VAVRAIGRTLRGRRRFGGVGVEQVEWRVLRSNGGGVQREEVVLVVRRRLVPCSTSSYGPGKKRRKKLRCIRHKMDARESRNRYGVDCQTSARACNLSTLDAHNCSTSSIA
jgi:hypothetical protein